MKFSFLGVDITIKKEHEKNILSLNDLDHINNELLVYLRNLTEDEINYRIQDVTCTLNQGVKKIKETWKDDIIKFKKIREKYLIYN